MAPSQRPLAWGPIVGAMVGGAAVAGVMFWRVNLQAIEGQIKSRTSSVKKLVLSGRIPPNEEVMDYLTSRQDSLERRYQSWVARVGAAAVAEAASADPQLYFQERFHGVQRTLERLAAARSMAVTEQLGFPKELPPSDTVPRLLVQLALIEEAADVLFAQGLTALASFKIEDPQAVAEREGEGVFLTRLPVRVRLSATLPQLMKILGAIQRASPLMDVDAVRIAPAPQQSSGAGPAPPQGGAGQAPATSSPAPPPAGVAPATSPEVLEVELQLSRYVVSAAQEPASEERAAGADARQAARPAGRAPAPPSAARPASSKKTEPRN